MPGYNSMDMEDVHTPALSVEGADVRVDSRMIKDDRVKEKADRSIFDPEEDANRLG